MSLWRTRTLWLFEGLSKHMFLPQADLLPCVLLAVCHFKRIIHSSTMWCEHPQVHWTALWPLIGCSFHLLWKPPKKPFAIIKLFASVKCSCVWCFPLAPTNIPNQHGVDRRGTSCLVSYTTCDPGFPRRTWDSNGKGRLLQCSYTTGITLTGLLPWVQTELHIKSDAFHKLTLNWIHDIWNGLQKKFCRHKKQQMMLHNHSKGVIIQEDKQFIWMIV